MIIIDTVLLWALRVVMVGAFAGAGCMVALVLIHDKRIREAETAIRERNKRLREVDTPRWEDIRP